MDTHRVGRVHPSTLLVVGSHGGKRGGGEGPDEMQQLLEGR